MKLKKSIAGLLIAPSLLLSGASSVEKIPEARTINGSYVGKHLPGFNQDAFLGMYYAQSTAGQNRFRRPLHINESWTGVKEASKYSPACPQDSPPNVFFNDTSEDCLSINVVRPSGLANNDKLPVLVWVYGGGFDGGGSSDPRYNMSGIVHLSQDMDKPIIGVSFNYRINKLGFMQSPTLLKEGSANAGIHDQRLALKWIQENIAGFGGDPKRVTIWGESAGAQAIGLHLYAYDGKDDELYHAAIMESGGPVGAPMQTLSWYAGYVESLAKAMGCHQDGDPDPIQCFRDVSTQQWQDTQTTGLIWNPRFGPRGIDNEDDLRQAMLSYRRYSIRPPMIEKLLELYPNDPSQEPPYYLNPNPVVFPERGLQWRRAAAISGDMVMIAGRRRVSEQMTAAGAAVYSYRFDTLAYGNSLDGGVTHFQNVAYSFQNISGNLGPLPQYSRHKVLSEEIGRAYISFVYDYDPNSSRGKNSTLPYWPKYDLQHPKNIVLNESRSWVEDDTYRQQGINFLNEVSSDIQVLS